MERVARVWVGERVASVWVGEGGKDVGRGAGGKGEQQLQTLQRRKSCLIFHVKSGAYREQTNNEQPTIHQIKTKRLMIDSLFMARIMPGGKTMKVNEPVRQKSERQNSWQQAEQRHAKL